jgi:hypothetical protein
MVAVRQRRRQCGASNHHPTSIRSQHLAAAAAVEACPHDRLLAWVTYSKTAEKTVEKAVESLEATVPPTMAVWGAKKRLLPRQRPFDPEEAAIGCIKLMEVAAEWHFGVGVAAAAIAATVVVSAVECVDGEEAKQYLRHSIRRML